MQSPPAPTTRERPRLDELGVTHRPGPIPISLNAERPSVRGPFLWLGREKLVVKAVTYGTFTANEDGELFPPRAVVRSDFEAMAAAGVNTVRTYTEPPNWLLDEARAAGLRLLVGIFWEGRNCSYDDPETEHAAVGAVRSAVSRCKHYPDVVLAYVIGNEIPPLVTRFHGWRIVESLLEKLYEVAKEEDPEGLVTYGNYPSTEFLQLDFLDFHTFNVYLLEREALGAYLDRMLIQTKGKPLVLGEIGDDSMRPGVEHQAELLDWSIPLVLDKGVAGLCVFSWTDDWVVGGARVEEWAFGVVDRERRPKPAFDVVQRRFAEAPADRRDEPWPRISVVVCNYNGAATLEETLCSLGEIDYPDYEVIYVDDGSTDASLEIARRFEPDVRIIAQENRGLSVARNVGAEAATGEVVAYIDSDAFADPDWLRFLVLSLESGGFDAVGGPNLTPEADGLVAQFIAMCPGNPTYVLKDNVRADHIAGVNMAFRKEALRAIGGFDPIHTKAGDDVDVCWRLEDAGMSIAFSPAAIVWHHRRPSLARYLRQQYGYGEAENQLERKHPERFNLGGYIRWRGRVYIAPKRASALFRPFIYHGHFGTGLFQTLYQKDPSYFMFGPSMIQWYGAWALLVALSPLSPWLLAVGGVLLLLSLWVAFVQGFTTEVPVRLTRRQAFQKVWIISLLHFLHPIVRWWGRVAPRFGKSIEPETERRRESVRLGSRLRELGRLGSRCKERRSYWGVGASDREQIVRGLHQSLKANRMAVSLGQDWENYDLHIDGSLVTEGRVYSAPEHYDRAVCVGFKAYTRRIVLAALVVSLAGAATATYLDWRLCAVFAIPALLLFGLLGARARVRRATWRSVDEVMGRLGATPMQPAGSRSRVS